MIQLLVGLITLCGADGLAFPHRGLVSMTAAPPSPVPASVPAHSARGSRRSSRASLKSQVFVDDVVETKGGFIVDLRHKSFGSSESWHSLTMSKDKLAELSSLLPEGMDAQPDVFGAAVIKYLATHLPSISNTEGTLDPSQFPINYFSVRQVWHFFPDATPDLVELMQAPDLIFSSERVVPGEEVPQPWNVCPPSNTYKECDFTNAKPAASAPGAGDINAEEQEQNLGTGDA